MSTRLNNTWYMLRSSFWFVPLVMVSAAVVLAFVAEEIDARYDGEDVFFVYGGSPEGARELMSAVAASSITVAGVVFSITLATLTLSSQQFGPRILRTFMRDLGNQIVLGTFLATFMYCLLVLRVIRGGATIDDEVVPGISVTVGIGLAIASIAVLIYFIHHAASAIQASTLIAAIGKDLDAAMARLFPSRLGEEAESDEEARRKLPTRFDEEAKVIKASGSGYIEAIDNAGVLELARSLDAIVSVERRPGQYVIRGADLMRVWPPDRADEDMEERANALYLLGTVRTLEQDIEFAAEQLVEIASRALSPSTNDPFTAHNCIDRLAAGVVRFAEMEEPSAYRMDGDGNVRVIAASRVTFAGLMDASFHHIRQYGGKHPSVMIRMLEAFAAIADHMRTDEQREALLRHAGLVERAALRNIEDDYDRAEVVERHERVLGVLGVSQAEALAGGRADGVEAGSG